MSEISKQSKGGLARQASMTPEQRKEAASNAARTKVELSKLPKATHFGTLKIGEVEMPCFVLNDGRRVISGRSSVSYTHLTLPTKRIV